MPRIARTLLLQYVRLSVRPSVCLFVTRRYSIETAKHIVKVFKFFSHSGSHTILLFICQTVLQYTDGDPPPTKHQLQEAYLSQRSRAMFRVIERFAKSLKVTEGHFKWTVG